MKPVLRVLDVAAGAGDQTLDIARRVGASGSVLATDLSPAIIDLARGSMRGTRALKTSKRAPWTAKICKSPTQASTLLFAASA